jgi:hypothetical protein
MTSFNENVANRAAKLIAGEMLTVQLPAGTVVKITSGLIHDGWDVWRSDTDVTAICLSMDYMLEILDAAYKADFQLSFAVETA